MKAILAILPLLLLLTSCGDDPAQQPAEAQTAVPELVADAPGFSGSNAYAHCATLCNMGPRTSGSKAYEQQLLYLVRQLEAYGWKTSRQPFTAPNGVKMTNLHATYGETDGVRPLLISCHIDTKELPDFIGADDGASAAGAMVELARVLARTPELAAGVELVFFDGEECGNAHERMNLDNSLFGSQHDAEIRRKTDTLPRWQINLDMVGGRDKTIAPPVLDCDKDLLDLYLATVEALGYSARRWTIHPGSYLDDHLPFLHAGVPTLNLIAEFSGSNWWHTSKDTMERISAGSLEDTGKLTLELVRRLLQ